MRMAHEELAQTATSISPVSNGFRFALKGEVEENPADTLTLTFITKPALPFCGGAS
ncbi:hypothetical protein C725_3005 [Pacificimonas flava]|uniref:Uncharacterized protein n=1 Tax=Pacificimonas flava TaxID=1234595 RepID=M2U0R9_9SPHN|nr:hypothetical protein C725_3005 [Pacificimonas flava]